MSRPPIDISGRVFGKWTVIRFTRSTLLDGALFWCVCECGIEREVRGSAIRRGTSTSCGCTSTQTVRASAVARRATMVEPPPVPGARWIPLTRGQFALVDEVLFDGFSRYVWQCSDDGYATRADYISKGNQRVVFLHCEVFGAHDCDEVDHKNRVRLDCRRENLRPATRAQNGANTTKRAYRVGIAASSKYKGVMWEDGLNPWRACIRVNGKLISLGKYATEHEAAVAYDCAALYYRGGEFAHTNFPWKDVA